MADTGEAADLDAVCEVIGPGEDFAAVGTGHDVPFFREPFLVDQFLDEAVHGCKSAGIDVDQAKRATDIPGDGQNIIAKPRCKS